MQSSPITSLGREDDRALDHVAQLAHVAGVVVGEQQPLGLGRELGGRLAHAGGEARQEVRRQRQDVLAALAQRRHADVEDVEAVVEVEAERAALDLVGQVLVGRRDDAHVDREIARAAEPPEGHLLEHLEQLGLGGHRHLADLVEEQRAAVGLLEQAALLRLGVGEGAALVTEELALEQALGHRGAVDLDERAVLAADGPAAR